MPCPSFIPRHYGLDVQLGHVHRLIGRRGLLTLAIETSCDDTCVAIIGQRRPHAPTPAYLSAKGPFARLFFNEKLTLRSSEYKGIHPIEALDSHRTHLAQLISTSLQYLPAADKDDDTDTNTIEVRHHGRKHKPDFISVTRGPGMRSNLSCGLDTAKGLATAWQIPLVAVHHMQAHALTPRLVSALQDTEEIRPRFPFLNLLISGGHTLLVHSTGLTDHKVMASTNDTAIGDALDKIGRLVLPPDHIENVTGSAFARELSRFAFPSPDHFGAWKVPMQRIEEIEKSKNEFGWKILTPLADTRELTFSFSGIASRVHSLWDERQEAVSTISYEERLLFARTALGTAFEHLGGRTIIALEQLRQEGNEPNTLVVSGGVAANEFLRYLLRKMLDARGFESVELLFPPVPLCTDNAAMIGWAGMEMFEAGYESSLGCTPIRKWSLDNCNEGTGRGVLGVEGWLRRQNQNHEEMSR